MPPLHNHKLIVLRFAYLHIHPGGGLEKAILLTPSFQRFLDSTAQEHIVDLLNFIDAHVPHSARSRQGFDEWVLYEKPNLYEEREYDKWVETITPMPKPNWTEVDTSNA